MTDLRPGGPRPLKGDNVHLWVMNTSSLACEEVLAQSESVLSDAELQRCRRFTQESGRCQFVFARWALRHLLSVYCPQVEPADWQFRSGETGRPELSSGFEGVDAPSFNLSHSRDCVVLAFSRAGVPGVDVEAIDREGLNLDVARRYFSGYEVAALDALPTSSRRLRFLMLWTLKEASSKAIGGALGPALRSHVFDFPMPDRIEFSGTGYWQFWQFVLPGGYLSALAIKISQPVPGLKCQFYHFAWPNVMSEYVVQKIRSSA